MQVARLLCAQLVVFVSGCLSFEYSESTPDEAHSVDKTKLGREVTRLADEESNAFESEAEVLPEDDTIRVTAESALLKVLKASTPDKGITGGGFFDTSSDRFMFYDEAAVRLVVLARDEPIALSYPNGKIYVTTGLTDPTFPCGAKNESQLVGILSHEVVHLREGHVIEQWIAIAARERSFWKRFFSGLTWVTYPVFKYTYTTGAAYNDPGDYARRIEYHADLEAVKILQRLQLSPEEYVKFLVNLLEFDGLSGREQARYSNELEGRIVALKHLVSPSPGAKFRQMHGEGEPQLLTREMQYSLCYQAYFELSAAERRTFLSWLDNPNGQILNDAVSKRVLGKMGFRE